MKRRLLVVEDDALFSSLIVDNFSNRGYECQTASAVKEVQSLDFAHWTPDYCLLDMSLPDGSGIELMEPLLIANPKMCIVVLTGFGTIQTAVDSMKLGAADYLTKPVDSSEIAKIFEREAKQKRSESSEKHTLFELEKDYVLEVLERNQMNISITAKELGLHRRTLQRKLSKWGVRD